MGVANGIFEKDQDVILGGKHDVVPWNEEHDFNYWISFLLSQSTDGIHTPFKEDLSEDLIDTKWEPYPVLPITNGEYWCVRNPRKGYGCQYYD